MIVLPKIPADVVTAPLQRSFTLEASAINALVPFGASAAYLTAYLRAWMPYRDFWNYEDGMIWKGALDLYAALGDQALLDFVTTEVTSRVTPSGAIPSFRPDEYNIDGVHAGKVLLPLWELTGDDRYRRAMDVQWSQLESHPRTHSGNYWHKQIYPWQVWLDGLYMAQPFQAQFARVTSNPNLVSDMVRQFLNADLHMKNAVTGLSYHGWDESKAERWADPVTGCSPCFWGRAMGWWVMALADAHDVTPRDELARLLRSSLTALLAVRSPGGLWHQVLDQGSRQDNYEEASASLMIAYALMKAARLGIVHPDAGRAGYHALQAVCARFLTVNALDGICGVAGLGNIPYRDGSYAYYMSEKITPNDPKGVGALMMALSEGLQNGY